MKRVLLLLFFCATSFLTLTSFNDEGFIPSVTFDQNQYIPDVTYQITERVDRRGNGTITFYNLEVTNNTDMALYVYGSVHIMGTSEQETRHYAGVVPAHRTKSLFETVDEQFYVVKMTYQESL